MLSRLTLTVLRGGSGVSQRRMSLPMTSKPRLLSSSPASAVPPPPTPPPAPTEVVVEGYSKLVSFMHWLVMPAFVGSIGAVLQAQQVKGKEKGEWMFRHKSLGLLSGLLIAPRLVARLSSKAPGILPGASSIEHFAASVTHGALYAFMLVMPATGIAMGYYGGKGLPFFWTTIPSGETNGDVAKQAFNIHKQVGVYGKYLIPVHIGAAGLHAVRGHPILARINPFR